MAYKITYTDDAGIIAKYTGVVDDAEYVQSINERWEDPEVIKTCRYVISDFSNVEALKITTDAVKQSASIHMEVSRLNNSLLVVGVLPTFLQYVYGKMWQEHTHDSGWKTFPATSIKEANEWINANINP